MSEVIETVLDNAQVHQVADAVVAILKQKRKELLVWVGKKSAVWGPWALGAVGTVGHFVLGLF